MENASKALIMAGSILMAILVIGSLVFMFNKLSNIEQTKSDVYVSEKLTEYNKKFEQFNKRIYGNELLSLANLQEDYNKLEGEKGYAEIEINVAITEQVEANGEVYLTTGNKDITDISNARKSIEQDIEYYENKKYNGKTVKFYAQKSDRELANIFEVDYIDLYDYDETTQIGKIMKNIEEYKILKSTFTEFKNRRFTCTSIEYGEVGRIEEMNFSEL